MGTRNWREFFGWSEVQLDELRLAGYSYIRQGKYDIALDFFEALIVVDPGKPYNWQTLGALLLELNHSEKAKEILAEALSMSPHHAPTLLNYTKTLFMLGQIQEGLDKARLLRNHKNRKVASYARALLLAYS